MACACSEEHHDMCYDGFLTFADPHCSCCENTIKYENDAKLDAREVYEENGLSDDEMSFLDALEIENLFKGGW